MPIEDEPVTKVNPSGWDEFIIPKNYKQVIAKISLVPNSEILFSNDSKYAQVCGSGGVSSQNTQIQVGEICKDNISWTMFEKIEDPFKFRAEQCFETLYVLVLYPETYDDGQEYTMSIEAEYVDEHPWFTVSGGIHEIVNTETQCGEKQADLCEDTIRCSLITCEYQDGSERSEDICLPRSTSKGYRDDYCGMSGLKLTSYGELPLDEYSPWFVIFLVTLGVLSWWFWAGWYYNLRIYQKKEPPFKVPAVCPQCWFPRPRDNYNYSFDENDIDGSGSFDVLDANQIRGATNRGTTKYKAPQFYFDDD